MSTIADIDARLRERGIRVTRARRDVLGVLLASRNPLLVADIESHLAEAERPVDLVTVYRTLELLEQFGLAMRVDRIDDGWRYTSCEGSHRHEIVCSRCGSRSPLESCELESIDKSLEQQTGFAQVHHSLQFYGTCPTCQG